MALQLWLPLNEPEVKNYGLTKDFQPVISLANFIPNEGPLGGGCYQFTNDTIYSYIDSGYHLPYGTGDFTIAAWIKLDESVVNNEQDYVYLLTNKSYAAHSQGAAVIYSWGSKKLVWRTGTGTSNSAVATVNTVDDVLLNKWAHVVMVRDQNDPMLGYFYINGERYELVKKPVLQDIGTTTSDYYTFRMGTDNKPHNTSAPMLINDARVYDHSLSYQEVQKLYQTNVLHYKFDDEEFENTYNYLTRIQSYPNSYQQISLNRYDSLGKYEVGNINGNGIYTYSMYIKNISTVPFAATIRAMDAETSSTAIGEYFGGNWIAPGKEGWSSATIDITDSSLYSGTAIRIGIWNESEKLKDLSMSPQYKWAQLERNDHRTYWTVGQTSRTKRIQLLDSSGLLNNATMTGSINIVENSPKFNFATEINNQTLTAAKALPQENLTVSFWLNAAANGDILKVEDQWEISVENDTTIFLLNFVDVGGELNPIFLQGGLMNLLNKWHLISFTFGQGFIKLYVDKQELHSMSIANNAFYPNTENKLKIINNNKISNLQIFGRALSANEIHNIYDTSKIQLLEDRETNAEGIVL